MRNPKDFNRPEVFIASMKVLMERYQQALKLGINKLEYERINKVTCLLCHPLKEDGVTQGAGISCPECPWYVILGYGCTMSAEDSEGNCCYSSTDKRLIRNRIKQLRNWIKIYEHEMARRKNE